MNLLAWIFLALSSFAAIWFFQWPRDVYARLFPRRADAPPAGAPPAGGEAPPPITPPPTPATTTPSRRQRVWDWTKRAVVTTWDWMASWWKLWLSITLAILIVYFTYFGWADLIEWVKSPDNPVALAIKEHRRQIEEVFGLALWVALVALIIWALLFSQWARTLARKYGWSALLMGLILGFVLIFADVGEKFLLAATETDITPAIRIIFIFAAAILIFWLLKLVVWGFIQFVRGRNPHWFGKMLGLILVSCVAGLALFFYLGNVYTQAHFYKEVRLVVTKVLGPLYDFISFSYKQELEEKVENLDSCNYHLNRELRNVRTYKGLDVYSCFPLRECRDRSNPETCWSLYSSFQPSVDPKTFTLCRTFVGGQVLVKPSGDYPSERALLIEPGLMIPEHRGERWYRAKVPENQSRILIILTVHPKGVIDPCPLK